MKFQVKPAAAMVALALLYAKGRAAEPAVIAITNVTVINPAAGSSEAGVTVVLGGGRIVSMGRSIRVPAGSQVIEGRGKFLIPGLADAHIHPYPSPTTGDIKEAKELIANLLPWGVTTAFSPGMPLQKFDELRPELIVENGKYPKLYSTVVAYRVDGPGPGNPLGRPESVEKARESVRYFHSHNVNGIKLIYDDASYASSVPLRVMKREIMEALIDEAHRLGIKAYVHAPVLKLAKDTLRAGADGLVHGIISEPIDQEFLDLMKKNQAVYMSTSSLFEGLKDLPAFLRRHLELYPSLPGAARVHAFLRNPIPLQAPGFNFDRPDTVVRQLPVLRANLKKIYDSGVTVVTGSDSAGGLTSLMEIILHVESGLTPMQALRAATINAQKMVGRDRDAGTIQPGKVADLVLLDGDPLADIRNVARLNRVFRAGVALSPAGQSSVSSKSSTKFEPTIPRVWADSDLEEWATPVAELNVRPGHFTEKEYYAAPVDSYRTYPLYVPGREPAGYWEMIQKVGPKPIIEPEQLKTEDDWIRAGKAIFEQLDHITMRSYDPKLIAFARSGAAFPNARSGSDGTVPVLRWVPTERGLAIGFTNCSSCHMRAMPDGSFLHGPSAAGAVLSGGAIVGALVSAPHHIAASPIRLLEPPGMRSYRAYGVPWLEDDVHTKMKTMPPAEIEALRRSGLNVQNGIFARWNGSPYFPAKIPDLIGVSDHKYLDHTGTHLNRGVADLMRYTALVSVAESSDFGSHHLLDPEQRKVEHRLPDEAMYALALYIKSLKPPANPNPFDENAAAGKKIFEREGCGGCHTPPLYTNNKLTLAKGFTLPPNTPSSPDIMSVTVGTDTGLALRTRKGTGYYKVPSLRGVWYRGRYLHDGSLASLEEMFDPDRLKETFSPGGWNPPAVKARAVVGHEFGLGLSASERRSLIAFLRTL